MKTRLWTVVSCVVLFFPFLALSQTPTTSLRGTVKDPSGAVIAGATVTLSNPLNGQTYHATSDSAGFYIMPVVNPAKYTFSATANGFGAQTGPITLLIDQPATINFTMKVTEVAVNVDVNTTAQTLNLTDATMGNSVPNETIEALPMDLRNPLSLLSLQPSVLYIGDNSDSRQGSVAGGRSDQGNFTLDGLDDNDQIFGSAFSGVLRSTLDSTEEFRVTTSNGTAAAGRSSGAQVNLVTRSGTNNLHGALYEYNRPTNTIANDYFNKYQQLSSSEPNTPLKYILNVFGGRIGGPIVKDKLFYFFNYEGFRQHINESVLTTVPTNTFMQGELSYPDPTTGQTVILSPAQVTTLDAACTTKTTLAGQPACPNGPGPNQAILAYYANVPSVPQLPAGAIPIAGDGLNSGSFFFSSPAPLTQNTSILKFDYDLNSKNHVFVRGNLQKDTNSSTQNLPGQPPASYTDDNSKGIAAGHTWLPTSHIVNDLRYAFIRQGYQTSGVGHGDYVDLRGLTQPTAQTRNTLRHVPVNNVIDTLTWNKGTHTMAFGGNWRMITNHNSTDSGSFDGASTNWQYANSSDLPNPGNVLATNFNSSWGNAYANMVGIVPEVDKVYNYRITSPTTGSAIPDGGFITKDFRTNEFEYFLQDTWQLRPNLTIVVGLRHTILQTPYEINGQQVSPTIDTNAWYKQREASALQGQIYEPLLSFAPSGKANGKPGYWPKQKTNLAPRFGINFSPKPGMSIRASAGLYFDHYGESIVNTFDEAGSFGVNATQSCCADQQGFESSPRFTGPSDIPAYPASVFPPVSATQTFPFTPPPTGFGIDWGIDNRLKTPYAESFNASLQQQMPHGFLLEVAYVGRLGRHLLQQIDLAEPTNFVDPKGAGDYFTAAQKLSAQVDAAPFGTIYDHNCPTTDSNGNPLSPCSQKVNNQVQPIPYFENVFPFMANLDYTGESATQAIFNNEWSPQRYTNGETLALADMDVFQAYAGAPATPRFWTPQFSSLYAWSSIGTSSYHSLQFILRRPVSHGLTIDASYTFSKSLDIGSETERASVYTNEDDSFTNFTIQNTWNPKLNKGPSDFDTHSLVSGDWVYQLPFGRGRQFMAHDNWVTDFFLGGWQWAGLGRWTSGLPFTLNSPGWATNYENPGFAFVNGPINTNTKKHFMNGVPHAFDTATTNAIHNGIFFGQPIRLPYPGEAGQRNNFRGDGYFDLDTSLTKTWKIDNKVTIKIASEVYNLTNSARFDPSLGGLSNHTGAASFGTYSATLSTYRRMQFGFRVEY